MVFVIYTSSKYYDLQGYFVMVFLELILKCISNIIFHTRLYIVHSL